MRVVVGVVLLAVLLAGAALVVLLQEPAAQATQKTTTPTTKPRPPTEQRATQEEEPPPSTTTPQQQARLDVVLQRGQDELRAGKSIYLLATAQEAVAVAPADPRAWVLLGIAEERRQQHSESVDALLHALRLDPQHGDALYHLGVVYTAMNRSDEAFETLQKYALGHPERRATFAADPALSPLRADPRWDNLIAPTP